MGYWCALFTGCQSSWLSIPAAGTDCCAELSTFSSFVSKSTNRRNHFKIFDSKMFLKFPELINFFLNYNLIYKAIFLSNVPRKRLKLERNLWCGRLNKNSWHSANTSLRWSRVSRSKIRSSHNTSEIFLFNQEMTFIQKWLKLISCTSLISI